jgi:hypothetical protein
VGCEDESAFVVLAIVLVVFAAAPIVLAIPTVIAVVVALVPVIAIVLVASRTTSVVIASTLISSAIAPPLFRLAAVVACILLGRGRLWRRRRRLVLASATDRDAQRSEEYDEGESQRKLQRGSFSVTIAGKLPRPTGGKTSRLETGRQCARRAA